MKMVVAPIFAFLLQLSFAFAAPPIALPDSTSIFIPDNSHNTTSPANASLVDPVGVVPRAPYDYHIRSSSVILRFDGYRGPVHPRGNVLLCLLTAANNVNMHFGSTEPISTALQTRWGRVRVKVIPSARNELTWEMWGTAIRGITEFVTTYV